MADAVRAVASGVVWVLWLLIAAVWTLVVATVYVLTVWWDEPRWYAGRIFHMGASLLVAANPFWQLTVEGELPGRDSMPFVCVCNHESMADVLLVGTLPFDMKWLSKAEIARLPFVGWMMRMAGDVLVRRTDRRSRGVSYDRLQQWLQRGASVMLFPEGTRSRTGEMLPFRSGAFRLAIETGRPVQPLAVSGTREAIRADSILFGRARVTLRVLEQVPTDTLELDDADALSDRVRAMIETARRPERPVESVEAGAPARRVEQPDSPSAPAGD